MNWEGTGGSTRILRGPDGKPIATVTGTFATVTHNGKTQRMNHADLLAAQAWCAGVLAGLAADTASPPAGAGIDTHRAAMGLRSRGTTPLRKVDDDVPKVPKGNALERLLVVLRKDPKLAWELVVKLSVLQPWHVLPESPAESARKDHQGKIRAWLSSSKMGGHTLDIRFLDSDPKSFDIMPGVETTKQADDILRAEGFVLLDEDP